jgi:hypothetical protein
MDRLASLFIRLSLNWQNKEIERITIVIKRLIIFRFTISDLGTPIFFQMISSGSGAFSIETNDYPSAVVILKPSEE